MHERFEDASWRSIQEAVKQAKLFQKDIHAVLASTGTAGAKTVLSTLSAAMVTEDFQTSIREAERSLRLTANLAFQDLQTQQTVLQGLLASSATNALQALQSSISMDWLADYLTDLQPYLEREPDTSEMLEHPKTDLLLPQRREHILTFAPSLTLLEKLRASHISLDDLHWRQLEELVADLLSQDGYEVTLGPGSKDEGKDIIAVKRFPGAGLFMSIWQAKKPKPGKPVGIGVIRELADTRQEHKASKGIIVTTTHLTKVALARIQQDCYWLHKVDGNDLDCWIQTGQHP